MGQILQMHVCKRGGGIIPCRWVRFLRTNGLPLALLVAFLTVSGAAVGQSFSSLRGAVTDSSGGAIPGAQVNLVPYSLGV
ncbi:MAG: hypothetical protein ACRD11_12815 [Terriglobia bacterium]